MVTFASDGTARRFHYLALSRFRSCSVVLWYTEAAYVWLVFSSGVQLVSSWDRPQQAGCPCFSVHVIVAARESHGGNWPNTAGEAQKRTSRSWKKRVVSSDTTVQAL